MTRSSDSLAQRASRRGSSSNNAASGSSNNDNSSHNGNEDEREQAARQEDRGRSRNRRRSSGKSKHDTAAAGDRAANHGRGGGEEVAANDVLGAFYNMLLQGAPPQQGGGSKREEGSININLRKASLVLEAAAGNLALAANLYWDDYFATQAANQFEAPQAADPPPEMNARNPIGNHNDDHDLDQKPAAEAAARGGVHRSFRFKQHQDVNARGADGYDEEMVANRRHSSSKKRPIHLAGDYPTPSKRRLRRSLESDFQAADDDEETKKKKRAAKRARKSNESADKAKSANNGLDDNDEANDDDQKMPAVGRNNNQEDVENDRETRPSARRRMSRNYAIRHQDIVQGDEDAGSNSDGSDDNEDQENIDKIKDKLRRRRARRQRRRGEPRRINAGAETSISVSDDELGRVGYTKNSRVGGRRRGDHDLSVASNMNDNHVVSRSAVMKAVKAIHGKINPNATHLSKPSTWFLSPEQRRKKRARGNDDDDDDNSIDSGNEDYICDDDWLGTETHSTPLEHLWGTYIDPDQNSVQRLEPEEGGDSRKDEESNGNVVADDDAMNVSGEEEDGYDNNMPSSSSPSGLAEGLAEAGIPHTWLNAGFRLSECGSGLVIKCPSVEEIEFFSWRQQQVNDKRNAVPPPHNCKALTAITSIVTGLMYTGASIQGGEVNFTSGKAPWSSLTQDERKREFESRLSDALSSLIFVAAQVSLKRKKKAYNKAILIYKPTNDESNYSNLLRDAIAERKASLAAIGNENEENNVYHGSSGKENDSHNVSNNANNVSAMVEDDVSKHANRRLKKKRIPRSQENKELMRRRLDLIPTCIWADKKAAVKARAGDGPPFNCNVSFITSWTNIRDIELYVKSNLRAFTEKGGIALFLETLLRIHGKDVIARQLNRHTAVAAAPSDSKGEKVGSQDEPAIISDAVKIEDNKCTTQKGAGFSSLILCTCEDRQKRMHEEKPLPLNVRIDPSKLLDTTPAGTECVSVELITLLLTGRISSDWKDCSSEKLGIGLLTGDVGEVSHGLSRPEKPVWLLKGETCYSVLSINGSWNVGNAGGSKSSFADGASAGDDLKTISKVDKPGVSLDVNHWNGWYGQRSSTGMRLVASRLSKDVPSKKLLAQFSEQDRSKTMRKSIVRRRRYENVINTISAEEHKANEIKEKGVPISSFELERIKIHSDDQKLYPRNHKMWRFDLGDEDDDVAANMDLKPSAQCWVPYFQLTSRQKRMVETKLGPKINTILWTRWPEAIIDNLTPSEGGFPVV